MTVLADARLDSCVAAKVVFLLLSFLVAVIAPAVVIFMVLYREAAEDFLALKIVLALFVSSLIYLSFFIRVGG